VWKDFAGGDGGDALDLVAQTLFGGDMRRAIEWSRAWLGLTDERPSVPARPAPAAAKVEDDGGRFRTACALRLFDNSHPRIADTPVQAYLRSRGINIRELGRQPGTLRYHPALNCVEAGRPLPAMLAAVTGPNGAFVALHRTWLQRTAEGWRKANLQAPKKTLGPLAGGAVHLWRGDSGKPLHQAAPGESVVVAEGIETGLSIAIACPERRVLAALSIGNMASLVLPPAVAEVIIAADNDAPQSTATQALQRAIDRFVTEGRTVRIARSPIGSDMNDALAASEARA
jgi:hypothetical protein